MLGVRALTYCYIPQSWFLSLNYTKQYFSQWMLEFKDELKTEFSLEICKTKTASPTREE